jgi:hypothetical protein
MNDSAPTDPGPESLRRANRLVLGIVLAVMALMATIGLFYALDTVAIRRSRDPKPATSTEQPAPTQK